MPLICHAPALRPSSIPLPCSVPEILPPPHVPKELNTPSPTRPNKIRPFPTPGTRIKPSSARSFHPIQPHGISNLNKLCSKLATGIPFPTKPEIRCGSLSPAVPVRRSTARSSVRNKNIPPDKTDKSSSTKSNQSQNLKTLDSINSTTNLKDESKTDSPSFRKSTSIATKQNSVNKPWKTNNKQPPLQNQTNAVLNKKSPIPRDQNRAPGHTFRRAEGKSLSDKGVALNQPDLVKVSSPRTNQQNETIAKLKNTNAQIIHKLNDAKLVSKANAQGFEAMTIVVGYLAPEALSAAQLRKTIAKLQIDICNQKLEASDLQGKIENQREELKQKDTEWKNEKEYIEFKHKEKVNSLSRKNKDDLEKYHLKIEANQELVKSKLNEQFLVAQQRFEEECDKSKNEHKLIVSELNSNSARIEAEMKKEWIKERARLEEQITELKLEIKGLQENSARVDEEKNKEWMKEREGLEELIADLREESKSLEDNMFKNSDFHVQVAHSKNINLLKEIDSLKTVVNMRTSEIHELRAERSRLEEKLELFDTTKENLNKMIAQAEDLREQINTKSNMERKFSEENRALHLSLEKEVSEKRRLSMENEQLLYKSYHPTETYDSLPISTSSKMFSRGSRPVSAPPGKLNIGLSPRSQFIEEDGLNSLDSPKVLEIVEKSESVSWKLEYEIDMMEGSPTMRRKPYPTSHMLSKFRGRGGPMSRSLNMNELTKSMDRSPSFTQKEVKSSVVISHKKCTLQGSKSMRKKNSIPNFETWSETCESVDNEISPENKEVSLDERSAVLPSPVNITEKSHDEMFVDISFSSQIEVKKNTDSYLKVKPLSQSNRDVASSECDMNRERRQENHEADSLSTVSWVEDIQHKLAFDEYN